VPATSSSRPIRSGALSSFAAAALAAAGARPSDARVAAEVLVAADLRGAEAHGIARLPALVRALRTGAIAAQPALAVLRESATAIAFDAGNGLGPPAARHAMEAVIAKAAELGAAFGTVRNNNDVGIAGWYAELALAHDQIAIVATNAPRSVIPTFARDPLLGPNPMAFAIPAGAEPAFVLDFSTAGPERSAAGLLPLGGAGTESSGHKGYGLGLLADILCGVLGGGAFGTELPAAGAGAGPGAGSDGPISQFFAAFRVDGFLDPGTFRAAMDRELRSVKDSQKSPGYDRIYIAGEIEDECARTRREHGIPIPTPVWDDLLRLAGELAVPFPPP
jgi:L-2-hydroxycarboxylate dehydrogenase (NAD+)